MNHFPVTGRPSQLLLKFLLDRPLTWAPDQKIVYRDLKELRYREFIERVQRLANVLAGLGIGRGDRVGVLDHDSHRYLELYFAVPMLGAVLHTVNTRVSSEALHYTIAHAEDKALFVHEDFLGMIEPLAPRLPGVRRMVLMMDGERRPESSLKLAGEYEALLDGAEARFEFPDFDEETVATLFYTTGTTGDPKGVFFTHRQLVLHTYVIGFMLATSRHPLDLHVDDVYLPLTPMFHVHAWGFPYIATAMGLKQVYPGRYEPQTLARLIATHKPTLTHSVPMLLQMLLHHPACRELDLSAMKILIGGSALPEGLAREAMGRGMRIVGGYGMSETCPVVAAAQLKPSMAELELDAQVGVVTRTGLPCPLVRAAVMDGSGALLPPGKENVGELVLQAPWLTTGYFKSEEKSRELWRGGWLHTGDVAYLDEDGYIRITDRLKDVIKIGGEWISSLELENALSQHEAVKEVAVVGIADRKWDERPRAEVVLREAYRGKITAKELHAFLHRFIDSGQIHKRAVLTEIHLADALPRTSVGKLDKRAMRARWQAEQQPLSRPAPLRPGRRSAETRSQL